MVAKKISSRGHILLWVGLGMIGAAIVLTLIGALLFGSGGNLSSSLSSAPDTVESSGTEGNAENSGAAASSVPASLSEARNAFEQAVSNSGNSNLEVKDVMEFANNYYAQVSESDTGIGAMELLINKRTGRMYPEPGPNMMWNTKYGMMSGRGMMEPNSEGMMGPNSGGMMGPNGGGMMGGFSQPAQASPTDQLPITPEDATQIANDYISRNSLGTDAETPDQFYGYYTVHTKRNGEVNGMLSVNGYTGAVWYHTWHGPFVAMEEDKSE
jgi:hypothetical protein